MKKCCLCSGEISKIDTLSSNLKILGKQFREADFDISYCKKCGLVQCMGDFLSEDFLEYYTSDVSTPFSYIKSKGEKETYRYFEHILNEIKPYINENSRILDVGGSWGELALFLKNKGYNNIIVVDPNPKCIESMKEKGIDCVKTEASKMAEILINQKYDMIIMNHILEHIIDINETLKATVNLLSDNGYLFIEVPNISQYVNYSKFPYFYFTYEHVVHFSQNDLENIGFKYNITLIDEKEYFKEISQFPCEIAIYRKECNEMDLSGGIKYSETAKNSAKEYMECCKATALELVRKLSEENEPLIIWGIGASTVQLLKDFKNVIQLIDGNPLRQGLKFELGDKTLTVEAPNLCKKGKIVILSIPYEKSIMKSIRELELDNEIVNLYNLEITEG